MKPGARGETATFQLVGFRGESRNHAGDGGDAIACDLDVADVRCVARAVIDENVADNERLGLGSGSVREKRECEKAKEAEFAHDV